MSKSDNLIIGNNFCDQRGLLLYFNEFDLTPIKRFYIIEHFVVDVIRAWQGHKLETKWFHVMEGEFIIRIFKPDDWLNPSNVQKIETFLIKKNEMVILKIPRGYINGFKAALPNSKLLVFSDATVSESNADNYRFDKSLLNTWENLVDL